MSVQFVIDMNLSPSWVSALKKAGWDAVHWSSVGNPRATDQAIMQWALTNGYVVFTHDLDFGTLLAVTQAVGPSVFQLRTQDVLPEAMAEIVVAAVRQHLEDLERGALVVLDPGKSRVRILPF